MQFESVAKFEDSQLTPVCTVKTECVIVDKPSSLLYQRLLIEGSELKSLSNTRAAVDSTPNCFACVDKETSEVKLTF